MSESVDLAPEVITALWALRDAGEIPLRCNKGPIRAAVAAAVRALNEDNLGPKVRPWDSRRCGAGPLNWARSPAPSRCT